MIRRPPRSTRKESSAASDVYKRQVQQGNPNIKSFDCSCFDGNYLTNDIDKPYLDNLEAIRSDKAKASNITNESSELIYNDAD